MRILLYVLICVLMLMAPVTRLDIAKLEPIQTVAVRSETGAVVLLTDTGDQGRGADIHRALEDLKKNTPGVVYLDTAEYLLLTESTEKYADVLQQYLKPSVKVSMWNGRGNVENAAKYLDIIPDLPKLEDCTKKYKNST